MYFSYRFLRFVYNLNTFTRSFVFKRKVKKFNPQLFRTNEVVEIRHKYASLNPRKVLFECSTIGLEGKMLNNKRLAIQTQRNNFNYVDAICNRSETYLVEVSNIGMESGIYILRLSLLDIFERTDIRIIKSHYINLIRNSQWNYPFSGNHFLHELIALNICSHLFEEPQNHRKALLELLQNEILSQLNYYGHYERSSNYALQVYEVLLFFCHTLGKNLISIGLKILIWKTFLDNVDWYISNRFSYGNTDDSSILFPGIIGHNEKGYLRLLKGMCPHWIYNENFRYPDYIINLGTRKVIVRFNELSRIESKRKYSHNFTGISLHLYNCEYEVTRKPNYIYGSLNPEEKRVVGYYNQICCDKSLGFKSDFEIFENSKLDIIGIAAKPMECGMSFRFGLDVYSLHLQWSQTDLVITSTDDIISCNWLLADKSEFNLNSTEDLNIIQQPSEELLSDKSLLMELRFTNNLHISW